MNVNLTQSIEIKGELPPHYRDILSEDALFFLSKLHRTFNPRRLNLLKEREERQKSLDQGKRPHFLNATRGIKVDPSWQVARTPKDLEKRWVEITGPTERKMLINALNSGANVFMADFEDANAPTWDNLIQGQINLRDAVNQTISFTNPDGKKYKLNEKHSVLFVRPRGWHLNEKHLRIDGEEISGSLFDFGLYFFHNVRALLHHHTGPYFYLPKLESHLEARLWNDVFVFAQRELSLPQGIIRATVLIETILAAFEMEEILYELRNHSAGLNAGRWDYIFSIIKKFQKQSNFNFPNRDLITMGASFMQAYTELLVQVCHKRGAHAIGGMAAFIPNRKDSEVTAKALQKIEEDKWREIQRGFDGTWVAHPDLVPIVHAIFEKGLHGKNHQKETRNDELAITSEALLDFSINGGIITEEGVRHNVDVALQYINAWLRGIGAAAIYNLMEDAATAEISRAQLWQWIHHRAHLDDGKEISAAFVEQIINEEAEKLSKNHELSVSLNRLSEAKELLKKLVFSEAFTDFLTIPAYEKL